MVWINVDETSIQFGYNKKKGTVLNGSSWPDVETTVSTTTMHERFSLSDVRARVSYIAAAANDLEVQRALPQVKIKLLNLLNLLYLNSPIRFPIGA